MSLTDSQTASVGNTASPSSNRAWLKSWEEKIEEEREDVGDDEVLYEIVRDLLLAPDDDDSAITKAVEIFKKRYVAGFSGEVSGGRTPPEYGAGNELLGLSEVIFEATDLISFEDTKHGRLAELLISLKKSAASEFNQNDPQFVFYPSGLQNATRRFVDSRVDGDTQDREGRSVREQADSYLSVRALLSKLFAADLLEDYGPLWVMSDFNRAFEKHRDDDVATNVGRQAEVLASANHILIAGEALLKEFKEPPKKRWYDLSKERWKLWASKLQEVADAVGENALWQLKARAQEAHDKMVELYPEAFTEKQMASE